MKTKTKKLLKYWSSLLLVSSIGGYFLIHGELVLFFVYTLGAILGRIGDEV